MLTFRLRLSRMALRMAAWISPEIEERPRLLIATCNGHPPLTTYSPTFNRLVI